MKRIKKLVSVLLVWGLTIGIIPITVAMASFEPVTAEAVLAANSLEDFNKFTQTLPVLSSEKAECFIAMLCDFNANKSGDAELIHGDDMCKLMTGDYSKYDHSILALKMDLLVFSQYARTVIGSRVDGYSNNADRMAELMVDMAMELVPNSNDSELTQGVLNEISGHYEDLFKKSLVSFGAGVIGNKMGIYISEVVIDNITEWVTLWNGFAGGINIFVSLMER